MNIGAKAVKEHADEFGLSEGISAIVRAFGKESVKDIEIISEGRRTALREISEDADRIAAHAKPDEDLNSYVKKFKGK